MKYSEVYWRLNELYRMDADNMTRCFIRDKSCGFIKLKLNRAGVCGLTRTAAQDMEEMGLIKLLTDEEYRSVSSLASEYEKLDSEFVLTKRAYHEAREKEARLRRRTRSGWHRFWTREKILNGEDAELETATAEHSQLKGSFCEAGRSLRDLGKTFQDKYCIDPKEFAKRYHRTSWEEYVALSDLGYEALHKLSIILNHARNEISYICSVISEGNHSHQSEVADLMGLSHNRWLLSKFTHGEFDLSELLSVPDQSPETYDMEAVQEWLDYGYSRNH